MPEGAWSRPAPPRRWRWSRSRTPAASWPTCCRSRPRGGSPAEAGRAAASARGLTRRGRAVRVPPVAVVTLRSFVFLDQMQEQLAGFVGTIARGYLPVGGVAAYVIETAPGLVINRLTDIALKNTSVAPGLLVVERSFGLL